MEMWFNLPNFAVIHVLWPIYFRDTDPEGNLAKAVDSVLEKANTHQLKDIALPVISTGSYDFPMDKAASIIVSRLKAWEKHYPFVTRLVLFDEKALAVFRVNTPTQPLHEVKKKKGFKSKLPLKPYTSWWVGRDSNSRPTD